MNSKLFCLMDCNDSIRVFDRFDIQIILILLQIKINSMTRFGTVVTH